MNTSDSTDAKPDFTALSLIDRLKCFNAKERYWAVRQALGHFQPSDVFIRAAAKAAGVCPPSESAHSALYLAMDYHLNWLHAAFSGRCMPGDKAGEKKYWSYDEMPMNIPTVDGDRQAVENSQEDVDLLLAYEVSKGFETVTQIILIEAKCSSEFTDGQLKSKLDRLALIASEARGSYPLLDIRFVLMSPNASDSQKIQDLVGDLRGKYGQLLGKGGNSHIKLRLRPLDARGFWKVRARDNPKSASAKNAPNSAAPILRQRHARHGSSRRVPGCGSPDALNGAARSADQPSAYISESCCACSIIRRRNATGLITSTLLPSPRSHQNNWSVLATFATTRDH